MIGRMINACRDVVSYIEQVFFIIALTVTTPFVYVTQHAIILLQHIGLVKKPDSDSAEQEKHKPLGIFLNNTEPPSRPPTEDRWRKSLINQLGFL